MRSKRLFRWLQVSGGTVLLFATTAACDEEVITDGYAQLWCEEALCNWEIDRGAIDPAPTWHDFDLAVQLADAPDGTEISRLLATDADCFRVTLLADIESDAAVEVAFTYTTEDPEDDTGDDTTDNTEDDPADDIEEDPEDDPAEGIVEVSHTVATDGWETIEKFFGAPEAYEELRLSLRKSGMGRAVIAEVQVIAPRNCGGIPRP